MQFIRDFFVRFTNRFNKPIPLPLKRFVYALYSAILFAQGMSALPPSVMVKLAIGAIIVHFIIELFFPNNGPPPKLLVWLVVGWSVGGMMGCRDQIIKARFGKQAKDSTRIHLTVRDTVMVLDTVRVPKDSILYSFKSDTVPFRKQIDTKRARLIIDHERAGKTTVEADCKPDTIYRRTTVTTVKSYTFNAPPKVTFDFGVSKWYKFGFYAAGAVVLALIVGAIVLLLKLYEVSLPRITRKGSGMGFKQDGDGN